MERTVYITTVLLSAWVPETRTSSVIYEHKIQVRIKSNLKLRTEREKGKKLLTFLCSVEGRTSSKGLLESWIAYPASLGVRTLTFSSLTYTKKFTTEERKPEIHLKHQLPWTEANRSESKFIRRSHILQFKLRFLGPIMGFGQN